MKKKSSNLNQRRLFLKSGGATLAGLGLLFACKDDNEDFKIPEEDEIFDLGTGDLAVLNYAYALEQLEADFYTKVVNGGYYAGANAEEKKLFLDLYNHEVNHREFFSAAISAAVGANSDAKLPDLEFDYGSLDFNSRAQVLATAKALEDAGVGAYNGAGSLISDVNYLLVAGKIVSVEARHASAIRSLLNADSADFAGDDVVTVDTGLDIALLPSQVIAAVTSLGFIKTPFTANNLP